MFDDINWGTVIISVGVAVLSLGGAVLTARWNRKSQVEANALTGSGQVFSHQSTLLQDIQEERETYKRELKEEKDSNKHLIEVFRKEFDEFRISVEEEFSGYREYIHGLRGQIHDLGGVPLEWPKKLRK